ncbi:MAG: glucose-1-phosphate cytidylyltransferase [Planctomycetota bacterium]|nr:MAG: glucose-1-phosphate cytidylyltransferase [Planctomycetota bacterium]
MKAVILCGGRGTRLREHTETRPKPMVEIGGRPILWHIMKYYAHFGVRDFVLCLGYLGHVIKDYFLNYQSMNSDVTVELGRVSKLTYHSLPHAEDGWKVTLADTGHDAQTGARVKRVSRYVLGHGTFAMTYGDGVSNVDLNAALRFHRAHGGLATITGVRPPSRYGELIARNGRVAAFSEKPQTGQGMINGGFFLFEPEFLDYIDDDDEGCMLERAPLERCAADGKLFVYEHTDFWQCMDTYRDWQRLEQLWQSGAAPWRVWTDAPPPASRFVSTEEAQREFVHS